MIRKIDLSTNKVNTLCGTPGVKGWKDGIGSESQCYYPTGLALNEKEKILFVSDSLNNVIKRVSLIDRRVETIYGMNGKFDKQPHPAFFRSERWQHAHFWLPSPQHRPFLAMLGRGTGGSEVLTPINPTSHNRVNEGYGISNCI